MGRQIWVEIPATNGLPALVYGTRVIKLKQFLPAGLVADGEPPSHAGERKKHLIQLYTDTGLRTLSVGSIRLKKPRRVAGGDE